MSGAVGMLAAHRRRARASAWQRAQARAARSTGCRPTAPTPPGAGALRAGARAARPRQRHRRVQAALAVAGRAARGLRPGAARPRPTRRRRGRDLGADRGAVLRRQRSTISREARAATAPAHAAQGLHRRSDTSCSKRARAGADAVLLIVAALDDARAARRCIDGGGGARASTRWSRCTTRPSWSARWTRAPRIVGVNNRNLRTLDGRRAGVARRWLARMPDDVVAVAESGICAAADDLRALRDARLRRVPDRRALHDGRRPRRRRSRQLLGGCAVPRRPATPRVGPRRWSRSAASRGVEDARMAAVGAGADALGLRVLAGEPARRRRRDRARAIAAALPPFVPRVGVFVNATPRGDDARSPRQVGPRRRAAARRRAAGGAGARCRAAWSRRVRVGPGFRPRTRCARRRGAAGLLLDTRVDRRAPGGTGRAIDWALAPRGRATARRSWCWPAG